jgi:hypothetical protein
LKTYEVRIDAGSKLSRTDKIVESCCAKEGLKATVKTELRSYPNSIHWHFKKQGQSRGTLEITFWKQERRIWLSVQDGRRAEWIFEMIGTLKKSLEEMINGDLRKSK